MNTSILTFLLSMSPLVIKTAEAPSRFNYPIKITKSISYETVTLTTYSASVGETDSTPHITASGFKIDTANPKKHRIIAVSRDLKKKWPFGTKVRIKSAGKYNGVYTVKDVMNKRYKNRVDILIGEDDRQTTMNNVRITKIK
jgi:3D (Asp-Asp-Asp) domain-containing protein